MKRSTYIHSSSEEGLRFKWSHIYVAPLPSKSDADIYCVTTESFILCIIQYSGAVFRTVLCILHNQTTRGFETSTHPNGNILLRILVWHHIYKVYKGLPYTSLV